MSQPFVAMFFLERNGGIPGSAPLTSGETYLGWNSWM